MELLIADPCILIGAILSIDLHFSGIVTVAFAFAFAAVSLLLAISLLLPDVDAELRDCRKKRMSGISAEIIRPMRKCYRSGMITFEK